MRCTYFFLIHAHQPVAHVKEIVDSRGLVLAKVRWVGKVNPRYALMLASFAKTALIVQQTEFLDNVIHDQVSVYLGLVPYRLLVSCAKLAHLAYVKSLVWV